MGVAVSKGDIYNQVIQKQIQKGGDVSCRNVIGDVNIIAEGGDVKGTKITQSCSIKKEILYKGLLGQLEEIKNQATSKRTGIFNLGGVFSSTRTVRTAEQIQEQDCGSTVIENIIGDINFIAKKGSIDDTTIEQSGGTDIKCQFDAIAQTTANIHNETVAESTGLVLGDFGIILIILAVIGGAGLILKGNQTNEDKDNSKKILMWLIIDIILIAGLTFFNLYLVKKMDIDHRVINWTNGIGIVVVVIITGLLGLSIYRYFRPIPKKEKLEFKF